MKPHLTARGIIVRMWLSWVMGAAVLAAEVPDSAASFLERAYYYDAGKAVPRDAAKAAQYYQQAADQGDGVAQLRLGYLCEIGDGVPQDYYRARRLYEAAAATGLMEARFRLAFCCLEGWGGPVDRDAFVRELTTAGEAGYVPAQTVLGGLYFFGFVVTEDRNQGLEWMEKAAVQDNAEAQFQMGVQSAKAVGLMRERDMAASRVWFQLSAEQEYTASMNAMAQTFMWGNAKERDWQTAKQWLLLSDEAGDADAPYVLGVWAIMGTDIPAEDAARAGEWFKKAADRLNGKAMDVLDLVGRGRALQDAVRYVLKTPYEERYVQRIAAKTPEEPTNGNLPPQPVRVVRPIYPLSMRYTGTEGDVVIEFTVDVTGRVRDPKVVTAAHPLLGDRALETIILWRFKPGQRNGRLVNTRIQVPIFFRLEESMLDGADGMLKFVQAHAQRIGGQVLADTQILEMARSIRRLPLPVLAGGEPPVGARALVVLVLDATGRVQRGHIIEAQPTELGPVMLEIAKNAQFEPVRIDGVPTEGSVVLPFMKQP